MLEIVKYFNGGVSIEFLNNAPRYFVNCCMEVRNDDIRDKNKQVMKQKAQAVIAKMKGK